ncbi:hypothetical protein [Helicobacter sp. 23-1045]
MTESNADSAIFVRDSANHIKITESNATNQSNFTKSKIRHFTSKSAKNIL